MYHVSQIYRVRDFLTGKLLSDLPRSHHALRAASVHVLPECDFGLGRGGLRRRDHFDHPGLSQTAPRVVQPSNRRRDVESGCVGRDHRRNQDGQGAGIGATAPGAVGRAGCGRRASGTLAFGQLANWPQTLVTPIERFMVIGTMLVGAYHGDERSDRLHGRRAVCLS